MDIYIFRHGQSTYNVLGRTQGHTNDSKLTDMGKEQAIEVGKKLAGRGIEVIFTSPLVRAVETAKLANQTLNAKIITDERFIEVDIGDAEGLHFTEIMAKYGDFYKKWREDETELDISYPNGETKRQVRTRLFEGLNDHIRNDGYKAFAVSGHGIILTQTLLALGVKDAQIGNGDIIHLVSQNDELSFKEFI